MVDGEAAALHTNGQSGDPGFRPEAGKISRADILTGGRQKADTAADTTRAVSGERRWFG